MNSLKQIARLISAYRFSPAALPALLSRARGGALPNTRQANRAKWGWHDWSDGGDEWSNNAVPDWKEGVVASLLVPFIGEGNRVLEIGPGAGRWSEHIIPRASHTTLVDLTPECIGICRDKFGTFDHIEFHVNDGRTLPFIPSGSIGRIWSLDVFVHIEPVDVESYITECSRVMAPGAEALIHHARAGARPEYWRSGMTAELMVKFVTQSGLEMVRQFESWGGGDHRLWPKLSPEDNPDTISVFRKPD